MIHLRVMWTTLSELTRTLVRMRIARSGAICFLFVFGFLGLRSNVFGQNSKLQQPVSVTFCDLIAGRQEGQLVRTTAIYRYGFEWSELYCPGCEGKDWLDESQDLKLSRALRKKLKDTKAGRTVKVTVVGRMQTDGGYGHMGVYRFRFVVERFEQADVLLKSSPVYSYLPKDVKEKANCPY